ncbi:N5-glutamine S-adenosyl-L-methionine-dependent methyltransferase [Actinokineospora globicatena]|uniref:peptide chain release factor N(5)-glutamine methyltransferase n=1 Tax=Actinokineospora globicatena TaxID=103729 RepID=A0A9W6QUU5_9PSEU|nr:N5-glutamine S-adenosyl-L-methionine-dependent methyltransferase [Actinokineospora globicatena]
MIDDVVARLRAAGCVFAEDEARLLAEAAADGAALDELVAARVAGDPLEHLLGWAEFAGARVVVAPGVFVPRRRTEFLAERAAALASPGAVVVDLCCGCGAIGAAVSAAVPGVELHAADIDPVALACARRNLPHAEVHEGDMYAALPARLRGSVDVIVANVPYVPTREISRMPAEARLHEPHTALDGGTDGLAHQRTLAHGATPWLRPGGHLLVETSDEQAPTTVEVFTAAGLTTEVLTCPDRDATIVVGAKPS